MGLKVRNPSMPQNQVNVQGGRGQRSWQGGLGWQTVPSLLWEVGGVAAGLGAMCPKVLSIRCGEATLSTQLACCCNWGGRVLRQANVHVH